MPKLSTPMLLSLMAGLSGGALGLDQVFDNRVKKGKDKLNDKYGDEFKRKADEKRTRKVQKRAK
jgi:hypothetical protein